MNDRHAALAIGATNVFNHGSFRGSKVLVELTAAQ
jgi:hypothetical protein